MRRNIPFLLALALTPVPAAVDNTAQPQARTLRVCSDPNNLPFSNERLEGFENKLAGVIASEVHAKVTYFWSSQRKNFVRNTLGSGKCDLVLGIPKGYEKVLTTKPYYRSTYVWVSRKDKHLNI